MVEIMDTTLRDGEQMGSVSYTAEEKLSVAKMLLEEAKVPRVEVASARVSEGERRMLARVIEWAEGRGLADRVEVLGFVDGDLSAEWIRSAGGRVVNLLAKGSRRHAEGQLRRSAEEHVADALRTIERIAAMGMTCNLYLEAWSDGMLEDPAYVRFFLDRMEGAPVARFLLPDTLGVLTPERTYDFVRRMVEAYPGRRFDFHGHDDYGLATANSLAAVRAGARGVHCAVNGMGERAGNAALDEVVVALHDQAGAATGVEELALDRLARLVEVYSGHRVGFNKPVTGSNVFVQTAGVHADGDKKDGLYANRLRPERFGRARTYALGKLAGKANLDFNLQELGIELDAGQKKRVLARVVELGDMKESITAQDLPYIIADVLEGSAGRRFALDACSVMSGKGMKAVAALRVRHRPSEGAEWVEHDLAGQGDGGFDACMDAVRRLAERIGATLPELVDYSVTIPPGGRSDALVQCAIAWKGERTFVTKGVAPDQAVAAMEATEKMLNLVL